MAARGKFWWGWGGDLAEKMHGSRKENRRLRSRRRVGRNEEEFCRVPAAVPSRRAL